MRAASLVSSIAALSLAAHVMQAQDTPVIITTRPDSQPALTVAQQRVGVRMDLPLLDAPYNVSNGGRAPSMRQSTAITTGFYELVHPAIQDAFGSHKVLAGAALTLFDTFGAALPGGDAWVHEEFHRAVLGSRGVGSFDDIYRLNLLSDVVNVSHVQDTSLVRFKAEHPADYVRAAAAGIEGENVMIESLEANRFFRGSRANNVALYWLTKLNSIFYVASGTTSEADSLTDEENRTEGADVAKRDWVGHDFTAWVYDLHRSTTPYTDRGIHPSGVGINRYVKASDLTEEERAFLHREGQLQLLNLLDPNLLGFDGITVRNPLNGGALRLSASASHYLTSFGHTIDFNVFMQQDQLNLLFVAHRFTNGARSFAGVDARVLDLPIAVGGRAIDLSPRIAVWMQPEAQAFRTASARAGGLVSVELRDASAQRVTPFVEVEAKTEGWVAGNVSLDRAVAVRIGGSLRLQ